MLCIIRRDTVNGSYGVLIITHSLSSASLNICLDTCVPPQIIMQLALCFNAHFCILSLSPRITRSSFSILSSAIGRLSAATITLPRMYRPCSLPTRIVPLSVSIIFLYGVRAFARILVSSTSI